MTEKGNHVIEDFVFSYFGAAGPSEDVIDVMKESTPALYKLWVSAGDLAAVMFKGLIYKHEDVHIIWRSERIEQFRRLLVRQRYIQSFGEISEDMRELSDSLLGWRTHSTFRDLEGELTDA